MEKESFLMKKDMGAKLEEILDTGAREFGIALTRAQLDAFGLYLSELVKWNNKTNLTAIVEPAEIVVKHFLDSLSLCRFLPEGPFRAADIGSGAGFPGLAIKNVRLDMDLFLVEPARRKATFLRHMARFLGLAGVTVLEDKVEALSGTYAGTFDVIFSRAFKEPGGLLTLVGTLLSEGGCVLLSLGPETPPEPPADWETLSEEIITLPGSDFRRRLAAYRMTRIKA